MEHFRREIEKFSATADSFEDVMDNQYGLRQGEKLRVYNRSRGSFLSVEILVFETTAEPLKKLFDHLVALSDTGLWLKPYRGIPAIQGAKTRDVIYLDDELRVVWELDKYPSPQFPVLDDPPASALLLPSGTTFAAQICTGDQLAICGAQELENLLKDLANSDPHQSGATVQVTSSTLVEVEQHPEPEDLNKERGGRRTHCLLGLRACLSRWFSSRPEQTDWRSDRHALPLLVAYHWTGGTPQPYQVSDISESGFYMLTDERPFPGTLIMMTLQRTGTNGQNPGDSIEVNTKVVRWGKDGVGFAFVPYKLKDANTTDRRQVESPNQERLHEFLESCWRQRQVH